MKKVLSIATALVIIVSLLVLPASAADAFTGTANPDHLVLSWTGSALTTQTFTWRTDTTVSASLVQYKAGNGVDLAAGTTQATGTVKLYKTDLGDENIHSVTATNLTPGTTYSYRVGDGTNWSAASTFTTATTNTTSFKFLVFGDPQPIYPLTSQQYAIWEKTITNAYAANPDAKFMNILGDISENGGSGAMWDKFFKATSAVLPKLPLMGVQGNHDTFSATYFPYVLPEGFRNQFSNPQNGPDIVKNSCYSYDYGTVHFVVLDSQQIEEGNLLKGADILTPQVNWLDQDLAAHKDATFTIVMMHKPIYYNVKERSNVELNVFVPVFDKYHVDLVVAGHDHVNKITYPMKANSPVGSTKDGTVYMIGGRSGEKWYDNAHQGVYDSFYYDPQEQPTYNVLSVNGTKLTIDVFKQDGTKITGYTIDKEGSTVINPGFSNYTRLSVCGQLMSWNQVPSAPYKDKVSGVWYVPIRAVVQSVNGSISWNPADSAISLTTGQTAVIKVGSTDATVNGKPVTLQYAPVMNSKNITFVAGDDLKTLCALASQTLSGMLPFNFRYDAALNLVLVDD
jgi:hypothetical protein